MPDERTEKLAEMIRERSSAPARAVASANSVPASDQGA
jgi:hypothetical protein